MNAHGEPPGVFHTSRLRLRLPAPGDAPALASLMTEGISARLASWPCRLSEQAAAERIAQARADLAGGNALPFVIEFQQHDAVVGWVGITRSDCDPGVATLTYWLGVRYQGLGLMREAAPAALSLAFHHLRVQTIRAAVQPDNANSRAVLRRLGLRPLEAGRIWCGARDREEDCEWWEIRHPALRERAPCCEAMEHAPGLLAETAA
jgi:RimJ/RimL family protein N-acetyltransferase